MPPPEKPAIITPSGWIALTIGSSAERPAMFRVSAVAAFSADLHFNERTTIDLHSGETWTVNESFAEVLRIITAAEG